MKQLDEAIFIHRTPYSESSLVVTFLTKEYGHQKFFFRGGKKKAYQLYPLSISEIKFYSRKEGELWNVVNADPLFPQKIQFDPVKSTIAFFVADVLNMVLRGTEKDIALYNFVRNTITGLDETEEFNLFPSTFLIGLAKHLGVQPLIENKENKWLDLKTGVIGGVRDTDTISVEGNMVDIVLSTMENKQPFVKLDKKQRTDLLGAIINYYKILVPGFSEPSTYEIVQEILA